MRTRTPWLLAAAGMLALAASADGAENDLSKRMREVHRRNLTMYIKQLHQPRAQNSPYEYVQLVQWIANTKDPRAIPTMIEVMSDTLIRQTGGALLLAADFLGNMNAKGAIPVLTQSLTLERRFGSAGKDVEYAAVQNTGVHLGAAAALFKLGDLQLALPTFKAVLAMGDSDPEAVPSNAYQTVRTPTDAYRDRPKALDTIYQYLRTATESRNPELRAGAALSLAGVDRSMAFRVAAEVLLLKTPKKEDDIHQWYNVSGARRTAVSALGAIGNDRAKQLLQGLAQDEDESVRTAAQCALRDLEQKK